MDRPNSAFKRYTMTREELQTYIASLPAPPKKVRESSLTTLASQLGGGGSFNHYKKKGGEY